MHTNVDSICLDLLETTIYMRYSLLEPKLVILRDVLVDTIVALVAILDACLTNIDRNLANVDQGRSISSLSFCSLRYSSMLHSPLMYSTKYLL